MLINETTHVTLYVILKHSGYKIQYRMKYQVAKTAIKMFHDHLNRQQSKTPNEINQDLYSAAPEGQIDIDDATDFCLDLNEVACMNMQPNYPVKGFP